MAIDKKVQQILSTKKSNFDKANAIRGLIRKYKPRELLVDYPDDFQTYILNGKWEQERKDKGLK